MYKASYSFDFLINATCFIKIKKRSFPVQEGPLFSIKIVLINSDFFTILLFYLQSFFYDHKNSTLSPLSSTYDTNFKNASYLRYF